MSQSFIFLQKALTCVLVALVLLNLFFVTLKAQASEITQYQNVKPSTAAISTQELKLTTPAKRSAQSSRSSHGRNKPVDILTPMFESNSQGLLDDAYNNGKVHGFYVGTQSKKFFCKVFRLECLSSGTEKS
ncbi:MAG: hypothetical protein EAZ61_13895 [Oscillatoriales cyanobacterium]|nr:MAG: hypothetical protein EAZ61_13895 [Oscillatoriales cyanobacterium]